MWLGLLTLLLCLQGSMNASYSFTHEPIDVVIPSTEKDLLTLEKSIEGILANGLGVRRVIVVSKKQLSTAAEWFDEASYPFSKADVALFLCGGDEQKAREFIKAPNSRLGWYYQQLLKFYAPFVIPGISSNVLVLDSDTIFLNPVTFINENGAGLYNPGIEYHSPYFDHARKLVPSFERRFQKHSGITHHMVFQRPVLEELFKIVEEKHRQEFWKAFCGCVDPNYLGPDRAGASEYEIYFNYLFTHTKQARIRKLQWANINSLDKLEHYRRAGYHYISCHEWARS